MKTVFITGASSGIGKETALLFQKKGWQVIATMRTPEKETLLSGLVNVLVIQCDVTDEASIAAAIEKGLAVFGTIDVVINNAGYYSVGVLEAATAEEVQRQVATNLVGTILTTKLMLSVFRKKQAGTIINLSSIAGVISVPLQSLYHATKWGVEGFSESLHYELRPFNICVKLIEPGVINTDFWGRSMVRNQRQTLPEYSRYEEAVFSQLIGDSQQGSDPKGAAETIFTAATDGRKKMRYPTGKNKWFVYVRRLLPQRLYSFLVRQTMEK